MSVVEIPDRLIGFYNEITEKFDMKDKKVLEVGAGNYDLLRALGANYSDAEFTGTDISDREISGVPENVRVVVSDAATLPFDDNSFDLAISVSVFEHIHDLRAAVSEIRRVLKPRGVLYSKFSPIWTSIIGHHNMNNKNIAAPWAQLYMNENEYMEHLLPHMDEEAARNNARAVYNRTDLNRLTRKDYYDIFINSKMLVRNIQEMNVFGRNESGSELTPEIAEKIRNSPYRLEDVGVFGFTVTLEKYLRI